MASRMIQIEPRRDTRGTGGALRYALALVCAIGLAATLEACAPRAQAPTQSASLQVGGPFHLIDQDGRPVDQSILKGKWSVVFFGYTFCPDYCPLTLTTLGKTMQQLGPAAAKTQVVFITVDPERDTPGQLKTYLSSKVFPRNIVGLTGAPADIAQVAKGYRVFYQKDGTGPNYAMDHSTAIYLMDPSGQFHGVIAEGAPSDQARQISEAMDGKA